MRTNYRTILRTVKQYLRKYAGFPAGEYIPTYPYSFTREDADKVAEVVASGKLSHETGTEIEAFERDFSQYCSVRSALSTNSGTSAIYLACRSIGITYGDEVIVPAYTFVATAQAVLACGGIPVFADIDETFTISPQSVEENITSRTKAIIPVHIFGNVADMDRLMKIARKHQLGVIEDCAQAIGASYGDKYAGTIGDIGCFSFNAKKALPLGQGGMLVSDNETYSTRARTIRDTGVVNVNGIPDVITIGGTFYMTEMQAVLGRSILRLIDDLNRHRRLRYLQLIRSLEQYSKQLIPYKVLTKSNPSYSRAVFMLHADDLRVTRDDFLERINELGIPFKTFYPIPLYRYSLFKSQKDTYTNSRHPFDYSKSTSRRKINLPFVEKFCASQVGMEFSPYLTAEDVRSVVRSIRKVFSGTT